jgi:LacI family transcriptional regulator
LQIVCSCVIIDERIVSRKVSKKMPATLKDIARKVGVSVSTVSYAINGGPRIVGNEIRDRVLATAKAMDYRPNTVAKSLITRRSHTIGIVPTVTQINMTRIPYFQGCLQGVVNESEVLGQDVLLYTRYDQSLVDQFLSSLLDGRADGVIFLAPRVDSPVVEWVQGRLPAVVVSSRSSYEVTPSLTIDNFGGVRFAIEHLIELGHTRIANIHGPSSLEEGEERRRAFDQCMSTHGLTVRPAWILDGDFSTLGGYEAGRGLFAQPELPSAVFCANDESAMGVMRAANEIGLRIPEDISVVGFDDSPSALLSYPQLTSVRQPLEEIGACALRDLVTIIEGSKAPHRPSFNTNLVIRQSTSRPKEDQ